MKVKQKYVSSSSLKGITKSKHIYRKKNYGLLLLSMLSRFHSTQFSGKEAFKNSSGLWFLWLWYNC